MFETIKQIKALNRKQKKELFLTIGLGIFVFALFMTMGFLSGNWS